MNYEKKVSYCNVFHVFLTFILLCHTSQFQLFKSFALDIEGPLLLLLNAYPPQIICDIMWISVLDILVSTWYEEPTGYRLQLILNPGLTVAISGCSGSHRRLFVLLISLYAFPSDLNASWEHVDITVNWYFPVESEVLRVKHDISKNLNQLSFISIVVI